MPQPEVDEGMLVHGETGNFSPDDIFFDEENEGYDFFSESSADLVETIQGSARPEPQKRTDEKEYSDTANNIVWEYLKDMAHISLLTAEEEHNIAKKTEEAEKKAMNILFSMPEAIGELLEISRQLKDGSINIIDVIRNIDEINSKEADREKYRKKTIASISRIKKLHEKKEQIIRCGAKTGEEDPARRITQDKRWDREAPY